MAEEVSLVDAGVGRERPAHPYAPGIRMIEHGTLEFLDHTADVGFELTAPTRATAFEMAAYGLARLARGEDATGAARPDGGTTDAVVEVRTEEAGDDVLLAAWLRELVYLLATRHAVPQRVRIPVLDRDRLRAHVSFSAEPPPLREIKGVTWHGLVMERVPSGWHARVVFDV